MKRFILLLVVLGCLFIGGYKHYRNQIEKVTRNYNEIIEIGKGEPLSNAFKKLDINDNPYFKIYIREKNSGKDIKAGYYEFDGEYSIFEVINVLEKGRDKLNKFTIPEGTHLDGVVDSLVSKGFGKREKFYNVLNEIEFPYPTPNGNFEGYIYPETYFIPEGATEEKIWSIFLNEFLNKFPVDEYEDKEYFYNRLILASVIEREAKVWNEKGKISSVFNNRIKKGMKLESDATVNYVYGYKKKRMYYKDLKIDSPYNTYKYKGLPPAPIANPDYNSVRAAYEPESTEYLFFVASEDGSGRHHFTTNYRAHLKYIKNIRDKNRKK